MTSEILIFAPGFILNTETLFQNSKIMVLPSLLPEGCPTSILEGMSWGLSIVCYNIKGLNELVLNNKKILGVKVRLMTKGA